MKHAWQWLKSLYFIIQMYLSMAVLALVFFPFTLIDKKYAFKAIHVYTNHVRWLARVIVGLRSEIRGEVPDGEVIVAAKHQSFFDILLIVSVLPRPKFIMKKQIKWTPIVGYFAKAINCVPVDRGKRGAAIRKMVRDVADGRTDPGQLVIFPQGTRVAAGAKKPYKIGTGVLYEQTGQPVVPAGTNVGVFWKRHGIMRYPGLAVVEFLPPIEPGKKIEQMMAEMEEAVETSSNALMAEAGFELPKD
ncbi:MAG: 1-acyl-sn-glycerol-3-phosphate acyltransferase [Rhodobacterales bacterium]|nr:MAG: 1-acyl-sn-glycerol-3-phosphate acyltransferase [Rhodobacterales bacterium]